MSRLRWICLTAAALLVIVAAVLLRAGDLDARPFHSDEGVNASKFAQLHGWQDGAYCYDPNEFHGPTLPYLTLPAAWLSDAATWGETDEGFYRAVAVVFGVLLVVLTVLAGRAIGWPAALIAAALCAASPAFVFYSRYYIHEMLLVVFTLAAFLAGWRYAMTGRVVWALVCGASFGLMHATKETGALAGVAMVLALLAVWLLEGRSDLRHGQAETGDDRAGPESGGSAEHASVASSGAVATTAETRDHTAARPDRFATLGRRIAALNYGHIALGILAFAVVSVAFYSNFFTHWRGPIDSVMTYFTWIGRGAGNETPHVHPFHWYLSRLVYAKPGPGMNWTEGLIVGLSLVGLVAALLPRGVDPSRRPAIRFLAVYTVVMVLIYSAIPYKTPWSMLSFLHGMVLLAGVGAFFLLRVVPTRPLKALALVGLVAGVYHLGYQAHRAAYHPVFILRNPYAYAHPTRDVRRLGERAERIAAVHPEGFGMPVLLIKADNHYWPIPFYLRRFERVGYTNAVPPNQQIPAEPGRFPFIITQHGYADRLTERLDGDYQADSGLRLPPDVHMNVYIRQPLWDRFIESQRRASE